MPRPAARSVLTTPVGPWIRTVSALRSRAQVARVSIRERPAAGGKAKSTMIAVHRWIAEHRRGTRLIMQVHDELVLEVPDSELEAVKRALPGLMGNVAELSVPLLVEIGAGSNWDKAH